jgi:hypothetical protein
MLTVQLLPAATELPQFEAGVSEKADMFGPVTDIPVIESAVKPGFVRVAVFVTLVFAVTSPKFKADGVQQIESCS